MKFNSLRYERYEFLRANPHEGDLIPGRSGRLRVSIKKHIELELKEIDGLVEKIVK